MLDHIRFKISNLLDVCNSSESGGDRCSATPVWSSLTELFDSELRLKSRLKVDNAIHLFAIDIVVSVRVVIDFFFELLDWGLVDVNTQEPE